MYLTARDPHRGQAAAKVFARDMRGRAERAGILIDATCPGLVDTEASRPWFRDMANAQSPTAAARDIVWLATLPDGARAYGELVQHRRALVWHGTTRHEGASETNERQ